MGKDGRKFLEIYSTNFLLEIYIFTCSILKDFPAPVVRVVHIQSL